MTSGWKSVTRAQPCLACGKVDRCAWSEDRAVLHCFRTGEPPLAMTLLKREGDGALFRVDSPSATDGRAQRSVVRSSPLGSVALEALQKRFLEAAGSQGRVEILAEQLGVTPHSLRSMGCGWADGPALRTLRAGGFGNAGRPDGAYTFPERNGYRALVGFGLRAADGRKGGPFGLSRGLVIPDDHNERLAEDVLVVEGASDVAALHTMGLRGVGRPSNASGAADVEALLSSAAGVFVLGENDQKPDGKWPGRDGAERIARHCWQRHLQRTVAWALPPEGAKDVRAWLDTERRRRSLGLDDEAGLRVLGQEFLEHVKRTAQRAPVVSTVERPGLRSIPISSVTERHITWLWKSRVPFGAITILAADPGMGKSLVALDLAARVSNGGSMPDGSDRLTGVALIVAPEDDTGAVTRPRLRAAGANLANVHVLQGDTGSLPDLSQLQPFLESVLQRQPEIRLVVLDTLGALLGGRNQNDAAEMRGLLDPLAAVAQEFDVAVLIVAHFNKKGDAPGLHRLSGSAAIGAVARSVMFLVPDGGDPQQRRLSVVKSSYTRTPSDMTLRITGAEENPTVEWIGSTTKLPATKQAEAEQWVRRALSGREVSSKELELQAAAAGISTTTLNRARQRVGVRTRRVGGRSYAYLEDVVGTSRSVSGAGVPTGNADGSALSTEASGAGANCEVPPDSGEIEDVERVGEIGEVGEVDQVGEVEQIGVVDDLDNCSGSDAPPASGPDVVRLLNFTDSPERLDCQERHTRPEPPGQAAVPSRPCHACGGCFFWRLRTAVSADWVCERCHASSDEDVDQYEVPRDVHDENMAH